VDNRKKRRVGAGHTRHPPCFARYVISDSRLFCQSRNVNRLFAFCSAFDLV